MDNIIPDKIMMNFYDKYPVLTASPWGFSFYLSKHIMRLVLSGIFDRFPRLKIIIGHMGELLIWWAERFDHRVNVYNKNLLKISEEDLKNNNIVKFNLPKLELREYLKRNFYFTTSGWFNTDTLEFIIKKVGIDRVLFSVDYPYEDNYKASEWIDNIDLPIEDLEKICWKNANKLLKLNI